MTHLSQMFTLNYFRSASNELKPELQRNDLIHTLPATLFSSKELKQKLHCMSRREELDDDLSQVA